MEEKKIDSKDRKLLVIIGILSVLLIGLFILFLVERSGNKENVIALNTEKAGLEQELTEMSNNYSNMRTENDTLNSKIQSEKQKIDALLGKMKEMKNSSAAEMNAYKKQIGNMKVALKSYIIQIDSLNQINQKLHAENAAVKKQMDWVRERNEKLETEQKEMKEVINRAATLTATNFVVTPISKKAKETSWKKCFQLRADFTIPANVSAKRGERTIYLRLVRPDDMVIAFSENSFFKFQNTKLPYSAKRELTYEGESLEVAIFWPNDGSLIEGKYRAELFSEGEVMATTEFTLR